MFIGLAVFLLLEGLVALQFLAASHDSFLTVSQMQAKGIAQGLPLVWHFGIWGDVVVISPFAGLICSKFNSDWSRPMVLVSAVLGITATGLLAWLFSSGGLAEAHAHGGKVTVAGYLHAAYMLATITIFALLYLFTRSVSLLFLVATSCVLVVHSLFGMHFVLGIIDQCAKLGWYSGQPLLNPVAWLIVFFIAAGSFLRVELLRQMLRGPMPPETIEKRFEKYIFWFNLGLRAWLVTYLMRSQLEVFQYFARLTDLIDPEKISAFLKDKGSASVLAGILVYIFFATSGYRSKSFRIMQKAFSPLAWPHEFTNLFGHKNIPVMIFVYFVVFSAWALVVDNVWAFSLAYVAFSVANVIGYFMDVRSTRRYFADPSLLPPPSDPHRDFILARRTVILGYLSRRHAVRDGLIGLGALWALILALTRANDASWALSPVAYFVIAATFLINETWMYFIRKQVDEALDIIDDQESVRDRQTTTHAHRLPHEPLQNVV